MKFLISKLNENLQQKTRQTRSYSLQFIINFVYICNANYFRYLTIIINLGEKTAISFDEYNILMDSMY